MNHLSLCTRSLVIVVLMTAGTTLLAQRRFETKANGAFSSNATWAVTAGSPSVGSPASGDTAIIKSGFTVTVGGTNASCARLIVDNGGTLSIDGSGVVQIAGNPGSASVNGTLLMSSTGTLRRTGTGTKTFTLGSTGKVTISGSASTPAFDLYQINPASTFEYTASANQTILSGIVFGNLTLGGSGTKTVAPVPLVDSTFRMEGKLTVATGVRFDVSTNILRIFFDGDVENNGTLDASVGVTIVTVNGAHWVNNGTYLSSSTPLFGYEPATFFNNTSISGTTAQSYYDLIVNGSLTLGSGVTVTRHLTINAGGVLTAAAGSSFMVGGNWTNNGTYNGGTAAVTLNGTSAQQIGLSGFASLILNNAAGATLAGNVSAGACTLTKGNISTGAFILSITGTSPGAFAPGSY
jgi:hypothetical protein